MNYLSIEHIQEIANTVSVLPISSVDVSQYSFNPGVAAEYADFLYTQAFLLDAYSISKTYVLLHNETNELVAYFTLSTDTVRLTTEEKADLSLELVPFMALPALKVGKLAVNHSLSSQASRKGYGSFVLWLAQTFAADINDLGVACRFLTVDADIEYDPNTPEFYKKNGFVENLSRKRRSSDKTVSMRKDIFD